MTYITCNQSAISEHGSSAPWGWHMLDPTVLKPDDAVRSGQQPIPTKNIILLSDGTGNSAAKVWRTNVWRLFESLDLSNSSQVAIYDDGVGSSSFKPLALLGGAFGWGLKRNVLELYTFLCRNYKKANGEDDDPNVFAFGFSRGAYTIRVLIGLIDSQGLVPAGNEAQLRFDARQAYRAYRRKYQTNLPFIVTSLRNIRDLVVNAWQRLRGYESYSRLTDNPKPQIRFVGLWDTVAAYGLPIEEMTRGVSLWIWPLSLPDQTLSPLVRRACHAISLDDERTTFHPVLWSEHDIEPAAPRANGRRYVEDECLSQVWFAGVHSNVGGGYPDDSLAHVPLCWIMSEADKYGLRFKTDPPAHPDAVRRAKSTSDQDGRLYDSRKGLGGYYRYGPRKMVDLCNPRLSFSRSDSFRISKPKIHVSVFERIKHGAHAYAPIVLPHDYEVVTDSGEILPLSPTNFENPRQALVRAGNPEDRLRPGVQEAIWNLVWKRRVLYFASLAASANLAIFPFVHTAPPLEADKSGLFGVLSSMDAEELSFLSPVIRVAKEILPGFAGFWMDSYASHPTHFVLGAAILGALLWQGSVVAVKITDEMRTIWDSILSSQNPPAVRNVETWIYRLRTNRLYGNIIWWGKRHGLPAFFALFFLYVAVAAVDRAAFMLADSFGHICRVTGAAVPFATRSNRGSEDTNATQPDPIRMPQSTSDPNALPVTKPDPNPFSTAMLCWDSRWDLKANKRYRIRISVDQPWMDGNIATGPGGFSVERMTLPMYFAIPIRRVIAQPWFKPIARIGWKGGDEYPLDSMLQVGKRTLENGLVAEITARKDGRLFLYVNDAVTGIPGFWDFFYTHWFGKNTGTARVRIEEITGVDIPVAE